MTIWDEIADLFKTKDQLRKEKEAEYNKAKESEKELLQKLDDLEKEYNNSLPKPVEKDYSKLFKEFDKTEMVDNTPTNDYLEDQAKKEILPEYNKTLEKIKSSFEQNKLSTNKKKEDAKNKNYELLKNLEKQNAQNSEKINNDMTKNNLYYSSIKENLQDKNDKIYADTVSKANKDTYQYIKELDDAINDFQKDRDKAISMLDEGTINTYDNLLSSLIKKRDQEKQKIIEYNENLKEEKVRYDNSVQKMIADLKEKDQKKQREEQQIQQENEEKYGYNGTKKENYNNRLNLAREFYSTLPKDVALRAVQNNHELKGYLGVYYNDLLGEIKARQERTSIFS